MATKITGTVSGEPLIEVEIGGVFVPWKQGLQNWASVTAVTGAPTSGTYTDADNVTWKWYRWHDPLIDNSVSGSVTLASGGGIMDVLLVSCGGYCNGGGDTGNGGNVLSGIRSFAAGSHSISIPGAVSGGVTGPGAVLGSLYTPITADAMNTANVTAAAATGANRSLGFTSSITGSSVTYGPANSNTAIGGGGRTGVNEYGRNGAVIIRVPSQFALV